MKAATVAGWVMASVVLSITGPGLAQTAGRKPTQAEVGTGGASARPGLSVGFGISFRPRPGRTQDNTNPYYVGNALGGDMVDMPPGAGPGSPSDACAAGDGAMCRAIDAAVTGNVGWTDCEAAACPTPRERARVLSRCDLGDLSACQAFARWSRRGYHAYRSQSDTGQ